jgi:acid phosphatase
VDHVVVVIEENHGFSQIFGSFDCPTINDWAENGALFTKAYAISHPSEPNYLALFGGDTFGVADDECPPAGSPYDAPNLARALAADGARFVGYSEDLPADPLACSDTAKSGYRRKHNGWVDFAGLKPSANLPFSAFPKALTCLPEVAFVVPNMEHDMHDGTPAEADAWLKQNLTAYAAWCLVSNSLLIVTFDEDNGAENNHILALAYGRQVVGGDETERVDHYRMLRLLCDLFKSEPPGRAAQAKPLSQLFPH